MGNLYCKDQMILTEGGRKNWDGIRWGSEMKKKKDKKKEPAQKKPGKKGKKRGK